MKFDGELHQCLKNRIVQKIEKERLNLGFDQTLNYNDVAKYLIIKQNTKKMNKFVKMSNFDQKNIDKLNHFKYIFTTFI